MTEATARRSDGERNYYEAPCCTVNIGILEEATDCNCPACGAMLVQDSFRLSLKARVYSLDDIEKTRGAR